MGATSLTTGRVEVCDAIGKGDLLMSNVPAEERDGLV